MLHDAEVGVEPGDQMFQSLRPAHGDAMPEDGAAVSLGLGDLLLHAVDCTVRHIDPAGLDDTADDRDALVRFLDVDLVRMEVEVEFLLQEDSDEVYRLKYVFLPSGHEGHVVHEPDVLAAEAGDQVKDELVQERKEEGAEQLRGDVADRHTDVVRQIEAALLRVEMLPQVEPAPPLAVLLRHVHECDLREPLERLLVGPFVEVVDEPFQLIPEDGLGDAVEA